jgi:hypothetical protein
MANTFELIEAKTLATSTASITFSSIPATFTDLKVVVSARAANALTYKSVSIGFNGLTTNLSYRNIEGGDSTVGSGNGATGFIGYIDGANATASSFGNLEVYIPNYTSANYKSWSVDNVTEGNASGGYYQVLTAGLWSSTAAITSITLDASASTFVQYSTFYLYGIKNS